jgi:TonB family protein
MRLAWFHFAVIAALFSLLAGAQNAATAASKPGPEDGTIVSNTYANEFLGFWFPLPDGWQVNRESAGTGRAGEAKRAPGGGLELLVIDQHTGRPFRNRIVVTVLDSTGMSVTTQEYVSKFVGVQIARDGRELVHDAIDVELAGKHFFRADYKQPVPGGALSEAFVCTKLSGYLLGWTFVAGSPEELEGLVNSLQRLSFRDESVPLFGIIGSLPPAVPGSARPKLPSRIRVSRRVSESLLIKKIEPDYPESARQNRVEGSVVLGGVIDKNGDVEQLSVVSGPPLLVPAALEAVRQWKYKPYLLQGEPLAMQTQITVDFQLSAH